MNDLTIGLLGALLATNQPLAVSNVIQQQTGVAVEVAADPETRELREVMLADDAAQDEANAWLHAFDALPVVIQNNIAFFHAGFRRRAVLFHVFDFNTVRVFEIQCLSPFLSHFHHSHTQVSGTRAHIGNSPRHAGCALLHR